MTARTRSSSVKSDTRPKPGERPNVYFFEKPKTILSASQEGARMDPRTKILKAQNVDAGVRLEEEDDFRHLDTLQPNHGIIPPPFSYLDLERVYEQNGILPALVDSMQTNIECTGFEIVPRARLDFDTEPLGIDATPEQIDARDKEEMAHKKEVETKARELAEFFDKPWDGTSFVSIREDTRRDLEVLGNAFIEVLRTTSGKVVGLRPANTKLIRMVAYDQPVRVTKKMSRNGVEDDITFWKRERRYVQVVGGQVKYFREFGASRQLNVKTGKWDPSGTTMPLQRGDRETNTIALEPAGPMERATELIHLKLDKHVSSPYGIPRWISNLASVIGSRRAEEFNLEFFDMGGVPPLMILVQGGAIAQHAKEALNDEFMSVGSKHQAVILEAYGTGDMDSSQNVRVTVERFGAERAQDSMFENYITNCDMRVQRVYRIPSIFLGRGDSTNFASAMVEMMVADGQVFAPERKRMDEMVNLLIMPELENGKDFRFVSKSLSIHNAQQKIEAGTLVKEFVDPESLVEQMNHAVGVEFRPKTKAEIAKAIEDAKPPRPSEADGATSGNPGNPVDDNRDDAQTDSPQVRQLSEAERELREVRDYLGGRYSGAHAKQHDTESLALGLLGLKYE